MIAVVGDSLAVGTQPYIHARTDARVGRTLEEGVPLIVHQGTRPRVMIVSLGTNDSTDPSAMRHAVRRVKRARHGRCTVWATVYRRGWNYSAVNAVLRNATGRHFVAGKWAKAVRRHPHWVGADGVHATPHGYRMRAKLLKEAYHACR